jgi:glutathione S-transferase
MAPELHRTPSFIESGYTTKAEYEKALAAGVSSMAIGEPITIGYWKIRGLAAALRMMMYYKQQPFKSVSYGDDGEKDQYFGTDKPKLKQTNSMLNLPYIIDGGTVITQSNSCLLHLGLKLGIDKPELLIRNHQVLDQTMDLRNDLVKIVYNPKFKDDFAAVFTKHLGGARAHFEKLEGFCIGPFMCGEAAQSGDFHVFEMLDQHMEMCQELATAFEFAQACDLPPSPCPPYVHASDPPPSSSHSSQSCARCTPP